MSQLVIMSFTGSYAQIPPMYSALKVDGKKLYELARAGKEVERKARPVQIYELEILECSLPVVRMRVVCSKGTYIRTLCQDIGDKLGCGAVMSSLVRTRVGSFYLEDARTLSEVEEIRDNEGIEKILLPVDHCFSAYPAVKAGEEALRFLRNGNELKLSMTEAEGGFEDMPDKTPCRIYDEEGQFYGVYVLQKGSGRLRPFKMFLPG